MAHRYGLMSSGSLPAPLYSYGPSLWPDVQWLDTRAVLTEEAKALASIDAERHIMHTDFAVVEHLCHDYGHKHVGHNHVGHNYMGHSHLGHSHTGHNYVGYNYMGHNYIGHNYIGHN